MGGFATTCIYILTQLPFSATTSGLDERQYWSMEMAFKAKMMSKLEYSCSEYDEGCRKKE